MVIRDDEDVVWAAGQQQASMFCTFGFERLSGERNVFASYVDKELIYVIPCRLQRSPTSSYIDPSAIILSMAPVKRLLLFASILSAFALVNLYPRWSIGESFYATFLGLLSFNFTVLFAWNVILYPKYFSPLRHLPEPTVSNFRHLS